MKVELHNGDRSDALLFAALCQEKGFVALVARAGRRIAVVEREGGRCAVLIPQTWCEGDNPSLVGALLATALMVPELRPATGGAALLFDDPLLTGLPALVHEDEPAATPEP